MKFTIQSISILLIISFVFYSCISFVSSSTTIKLNSTTNEILEDVYVWDDNPSTNYDEDGSTYIIAGDDNGEQYAYIKYNISSVFGKYIESAKLCLYVDDEDGDDDTRVYEVSNETWIETVITWNTKPSLGSLIETKTSLSAGQNCFENVGTWVDDRVGNTIENLSFALTTDQDGNTGHAYFLEREGCVGDYCPYLNITYLDASPEFPNVSFSNPTPADGAAINGSYIELNFSVFEDDLFDIILNWNETNYTYYDDSLVLMMNFDNVSALGENDTYAVDVSMYGNNGTAYVNNSDGSIRGPNATGRYGGAFEFDGVDDHIEVGHHSSIDGLSQLTIFAWVKPNTISGLDAIYTKIDAGGGHNFYLNGGKVHMRIRADSNVAAESIETVPVNTWTFVTGRYNGSTMNVYINAVEKDSKVQSGNILTNSRNPRIGAEEILSGRVFDGIIDEVIIWNRSLSLAEIQQQYFSNLYKYDTDKWNLYTKQTGLSSITYSYYGTASNNDGNRNTTDTRTTEIDICGCPNIDLNWSIDLTASCEINSYCHLEGGNISFINAGNVTINNTIVAANMNFPENENGTVWLYHAALINLTG